MGRGDVIGVEPELNNRRLWHAHSLVDEKPFLRIESSSCIAREVMANGFSAFGSLWTGHFMTGLVPAGMNGNMYGCILIPLYVECAIKCELTH